MDKCKYLDKHMSIWALMRSYRSQIARTPSTIKESEEWFYYYIADESHTREEQHRYVVMANGSGSGYHAKGVAVFILHSLLLRKAKSSFIVVLSMKVTQKVYSVQCTRRHKEKKALRGAG
jgi:hypothetical protein